MSGQPDMPLPVTSSYEPEFTKSQTALYREVLLLFNEHQIPYTVSGAFALQQHTGIWRVTKDLDLFLTSGTVSATLRLLRARGYHCEVCDQGWLAKPRRAALFVDMISCM